MKGTPPPVRGSPMLPVAMREPFKAIGGASAVDEDNGNGMDSPVLLLLPASGVVRPVDSPVDEDEESDKATPEAVNAAEDEMRPGRHMHTRGSESKWESPKHSEV